MTDQPRPFYERISDALEVVSDLRAAGAHGSALEVLEDTARDAIPYLQALEAREERLTAALLAIEPEVYDRISDAGAHYQEGGDGKADWVQPWVEIAGLIAESRQEGADDDGTFADVAVRKLTAENHDWYYFDEEMKSYLEAVRDGREPREEGAVDA